MGTFVELV